MPGSRTSVESLGELGDRTISKVKRRVLPLIVFLYFIAFLDRNNVGFAKLTMSEDLGLSATAFGFGAGMFFIGYAIFEIPSNAGMLKFGARKWIARILLTWGFFATAMAAVNNELTFYIIRFLLGAAEAGFFPAIILYLTLWFPARQRVAVLGVFILAQPIANAIGAPDLGSAAEDGRHPRPRGMAVDVHHRRCPRDADGLCGAEGHDGLPQGCDVADPGGTHLAAGQDGRRGRGQGDRAQAQLHGRPEGSPRPDLCGAVLRSGDGHLRAEPGATDDRQGDG